MAKHTVKPLVMAVGAAFMTSLALGSMAHAAQNPFQVTELSTGYNLAAKDAEGKCGEGKCGEGKCGADKAKTAETKGAAEGTCGEDHAKAKEGACGEDKAAAKTMEEGKCGAKSE